MIVVEGLSKRFGEQLAVDNVSFSCEPGTVTGFLGPNGAGKSTTLRSIVGLTRPSSGRATIGGREYRSIPNPGHQVGVLLDASAQHPGRSGREVLTLSAMVLGLGRARVDELLDRVQLAGPAAKKRVGDYSLGMRQRLGIAQALLGDPQVLILDEPANGLDPEGIRWMRGLLRDFADGGGTVLLSSHLLGEIDAIADELVIIHGGRVRAQGPKATLLSGSSVTVRSEDPAALGDALTRAGLDFQSLAPDGFAVGSVPAAEVGRAAAAAGVALSELRTEAADLEQLFLTLTGPGGAEQPAGPVFQKATR